MRTPAALAAIAGVLAVSTAHADDLDANKQLVRSVIEQVFNQRHPEVLDRYFAAAFVEHNPRLGSSAADRRAFVARVLTGFSDYHGQIEQTIAEGDVVMVRVAWTGTQDGPFLGLPPSGHKISFETADIYRIAGGKLAEHWDVVDSLPRALALGLVQPVSPAASSGPAPAPAPAH